MRLCECGARSKNLALSTAVDGIQTSDYVINDNINDDVHRPTLWAWAGVNLPDAIRWTTTHTADRHAARAPWRLVRI